MILTRKGITIPKEPTVEITSKLKEKCGRTNKQEQKDKTIDKFSDKVQKKIIKKECKCKTPGQCKELLEEDLGLELEKIYDELEICLVLINNQKIYNLLETRIEEIDKIISKLEKVEILEENPTKFWEKDKIYCKLEILNPNLKISTSKVEASNKEIKEFELHIKDLKKLEVIRRSESPHRSAAFIVNKHNEIAREKAEW